MWRTKWTALEDSAGQTDWSVQGFAAGPTGSIAVNLGDISRPVMQAKGMAALTALGVTSIFTRLKHYLQPPE
jgi:hypothetical protein